MKIVVENGVLVNVEVDLEKDIDVKEFAVPDGIIEIANEALSSLSFDLETLYIPKSVEKIEEGAFFSEVSMWGKLKTIIVEEGNNNYKSETGCLIDINENAVIFGTEKAIIPNGIEKIGFYAFRSRENLLEITIPASVKMIDMQAFACCPNLKKVTVLGKDTNLDRLCFIADTAIEEFNLPKESDYEFTNGCLIKKTGNVLLLLTDNGKIPSTVKSVENGSIFRCFNGVEIPETIEVFGENAVLILGGNKLKVKKDSKAEEYAKKNNLPYEVV